MSNHLEDLDILVHDGPCLVVNKPGGLLTQAPPGVDSLEIRVKRYLRRIESKENQRKIYLGVPHRLDRPVSGVMVLARHVRAAARISAQFEQRTVEKIYWALVPGEVAASGCWEDFLLKVEGESRSQVVEESTPGSQYAQLDFRPVAALAGMSLLEIQLGTGRTHQIRVQAASRGLPIVGDELYGSQEIFGPQTEVLRERWIGLHARRLKFYHPTEDRHVDVTAPLPAFWPREIREMAGEMVDD